MSPELERLLEALHEKLTCPSQEKAHRVATFERLLGDALARHHAGTSRSVGCWEKRLKSTVSPMRIPS
jgi:hypothetical protein